MKHVLAAAAFLFAPACLASHESELVAIDPAAPVAAQESVAPAQEPIALARLGHGKPVCGLGKEFHAGRRAELMQRGGEELLVFRGLTGPRENLAFRQDKNFWYLTGVESPDAALVLDGKTKQEILFLPEQNLGKEIWDGEIWDAADAWVKELTGIADVRPIEGLVPVLEELLGGRKSLGTNLAASIVLAGSYDAAGPFEKAQAGDALDGRVSRERALAKKLEEILSVSVFDVYPTLVEMRLVKTPEEVAAMRRAARAGSLAHIEAMRSTRPGIGEWELDGVMSFVQVREGAFGKAYEAIVGSGANACVLHYTANDRRMQAAEVVLIDYGPEVDHYTTDITRSWPTDGTFTPRAAELYDAVLASQLAGIAACKPGATIKDVSKACKDVFLARGLDKFMRHGPCHYIGLEVHDPGDTKKVFVPGMVFTVEPGLYDTEAHIG
ncbi:MAG: aminopeptidase P family protein, partial [Planctomycetes bacterium]|nr:aminopeptidase P family protein [Planctomycetota bacterium]